MIGLIKGLPRKVNMAGSPQPIVTFTSNVSGLYLPEILAYIQASQSGTGDPSPSNPRPINGVSSVDTTVCGKNLFDYSDSGIILSGFSNNNGVFTNNDTDTRTSFRPAIQLMNGSTITATTTLSGEVGRNSVTFTIANAITKLRIKHNGASQDLRIDYPFTQTGTFTLSMTVTANNPSVVGGLSIKDIQIEVGSTPTAYHAYTGTTATTALGGTYYGGYVNLETGVMTIDRGFSKIKDMSWTYQSQYNRFFSASIKTDVEPPASASVVADGLMCECYIPHAYNSTNSGDIYIDTSGNLFAKDSNYTDTTTWLSAIDDYIVVYPLATPQTVQLTPAQIEQLLGQNNVFCSTGDVAVTQIWARRDRSIVSRG